MDWTTVITATDLEPVVNGLKTLVPLVVGVMIPILCINKGLGWIRGWIYSA